MKLGKWTTVALIIGPFILWVWCIRRFLMGELAFVDDALYYYEHIRYYIESMVQGVFPLWEPYRKVAHPNEFFLRRLGAYNPFLSLIALMFKAGFSFTISYYTYLVLYYFLGLMGFYCVAQRIFQDRVVSLLAYWLLLFSTMGTKILSSYIMLLFVPLVWFFYFIICFAQYPNRQNILGATLSTMTLLTTYLPFYFITIFWSFLV